jgi:hypothetical protein
MDLIGVGLVYAGLLTAFLGAVSVLRPLRLLRIPTRARGALVLLTGLVVVVLGASLPASESRIVAPRTRLDAFVPAYQFHEVHRVVIRAPRERVYRAVRDVTANEILFFRALTWIRRMGQPGPESLLDAPERMPLLEVATRTSFLLLADEPDREIVIGTLVHVPAGWRPRERPTPEGYRALGGPGFAKAVMNFRLEDTADGACLVTTETRVYATDAATCRKFARYWRVIYPGSALIRRMWLRAIERRALAA